MRISQRAICFWLVVWILPFACKSTNPDGYAEISRSIKVDPSQLGELTTAQSVEYINNYALCELAAYQPLGPLGENGRCEHFDKNRRHNQQSKVDQGLAQFGYPNSRTMAALNRYIIQVPDHISGCFNLDDHPQSKGNPIRSEHLPQFFQQVEQVAAFLGEIHVTMHANPGLSIFVPKRVEICSKGVADSDYSPLLYRLGTETLTINMPYGSGPGLTPSPISGATDTPSVGKGYGVIDKDALWTEWRNGSAFAYLQGDSTLATGSAYETFKDAIASILGFKRENLPDKLTAAFANYWRIIDPLGIPRTALRAKMAQYRTEKANRLLVGGRNQSAQLAANVDDVAGVRSILKNLLADAHVELSAEQKQEFDSLIHRLNNNNLQRFLDVWQTRIFDASAMDLMTQTISQQVYPCQQNIVSRERKRITAFVAVENNHQIGICIGSQQGSQLAVNSDRDIDIKAFVAVSTSDAVNINLPPDFLHELTNSLDAVLPWRIIRDSLILGTDANS